MPAKRLITPIKAYLFNEQPVTQQEFFRELWSVSMGVISHEDLHALRTSTPPTDEHPRCK